MCRFQLHGVCVQGAACRFAHDPAELVSQPNLRKTQLCMAFQRNGICRDGEACKYAHGEQELRANASQQQSAVRTNDAKMLVLQQQQQQQPLACDLASVAKTAHSTSGQTVIGSAVVMVPVTVPVILVSATSSTTEGSSRAPSLAPTLDSLPSASQLSSMVDDDGMGKVHDGKGVEQSTDDDFDSEDIWSRQTSAGSLDWSRQVSVETIDSEWSRQVSVETIPETCDSDSIRGVSRQTTTCGDSDDGLSDGVSGDHSTADTDSETTELTLPSELDPKDNAKPIVEKVTDTVFRKTKPCRFYAQGCCHRGASCNFAHEQVAPLPELFRTRLCFAFARKGVCRDGDACKYAHGTEQLRTETQPSVQEDTGPVRSNKKHATFCVGERSGPVSMWEVDDEDTDDEDICLGTRSVPASMFKAKSADVEVNVKNTFVHFNLREPKVPLRRSRSSGDLPSERA